MTDLLCWIMGRIMKGCSYAVLHQRMQELK